MKRKVLNSLHMRVGRIMANDPYADYQMVMMSCRRDKSRGRIEHQGKITAKEAAKIG